MGQESNHDLSRSKRGTPIPTSQQANHHHVASLFTSERRNIDYITLRSVFEHTGTTRDNQALAFLLKEITNHVIDLTEDYTLSSTLTDNPSAIEQFSTSIDQEEQVAYVISNDRCGGMKRGGGHRF